jgi:oligoendopeptidase F
MTSLPFGSLSAFKPRRFAPVQLDAGNWEELAPLFDQLEQRIAECKTSQDLEQWLLDWSELSAILDEEGARRYIAMTCHTEDAEAEHAYLHFVEKIEPEVKPRRFALARAYVQHPLRAKLSRERYEVLDRDTILQVELFRPENVALETEEARLSQQYEKLSGSLTVQFHGKEQTLPQMGRYLEETDRTLRQQAWEAVAKRRLAEEDKFDTLFDELVRVRNHMAANAGFSNYRDYAFRRLGRFDYTPEDCFRFHEAVQSEVIPALRAVQEKRRRNLSIPALRPWDQEVDPLGRPPLRPFVDVSDMVDKTALIFDHIDARLASDFRTLKDKKLLDLDNRKGKAPGGYQSTLAESRVPFIFMNAVGVQRDVETILHEAGHAFHAMATQDEDLHAYRNPPIEFCEVASMSMELLGNEHIEQFYDKAAARRASETHLEGILKILPWIAAVDAFQHWIYTNPKHSREERRDAWSGLMERFSGSVDWSGYERERASLWHRQLHIFTHPFYYIEYGIAQLGALQVWANSKREGAGALAAYKRGLALGGSRPLPELFQAAGCQFRFDRETLAPLLRLIEQELIKLGQKGHSSTG